MQANGIARQTPHFSHVVPDVRVIRPALDQLVQYLLRLGRLALLHQQIGTHLFKRVVARVQPLHPFGPLLRVGQAVVGDVQVDLRQVVGDVVGGLGQQRLQVFARFVQLAALDLRQGQAIACSVKFRVFVELGAEALGCQAGCFFIGQGHARANQLIALAVLDTALGRLFGTVAGVSDTRFGHRVSQQKFRRLGAVAVLLRKAFEHGGHVARVVTGLFKVLDADAVGFLFVLPRETPLFLDCRRLGAGNHADTRIASATGSQHDTREQSRHHRQLHALLGFDAAGEVALRQVRQFVRQHRGVFAFGAGIEEQAAVDPDDAAGGREGVEFTAVDQDEFQAPVLQLAGFGQAVHGSLDVVLELRVVQLVDLATQQAQPGTAQLMLLLRRDDRRAGVTQ